MARISRKRGSDTTVESAEEKRYEAGAYVRLSAVDRKQKGDSIETQQAIIRAHIAQYPEMELRETYIDNGLSGQKFDRPAFQRMIDDLKSGKINCCVTKDLSRLGRNAIETCFYIEKFFPLHGIRFIAVNDEYDSADKNCGGIMVSLKNMVNEVYALEVGRKIHHTKQMNIRNGCFVGRIPPYGYLKNPSDNHRLIPDSFAAPVVRRVFEMAGDGESVRNILNWLNSSEILPPKRYFHSIGLVPSKEAGGHIHWNKGILYGFLHNRIYCGDMVQGKNRSHSYNRTKIAEESWVITENTHEAIVSRELFAKVQKLWDKPGGWAAKKWFRKTASENIFKRKIFCGHCGYAMRRARTGETQYLFMCETRRYYSESDCVPVSINENDLKAKLVEELKARASLYGGYINAAFTDKPTDEDDAELQKVRVELKNSGKYLKSLYEQFIGGGISESDFMELKRTHNERIDGLTQKEKKLRDEVRERYLQNNARSKAAEGFQAVCGISDLTAGVLDKLVKKILVFEDKRIEVSFKH